MPTKLKSGVPETHRECRACKLVKPLDAKHFPKHDTCANGFNRRCIPCTVEYKRAWKIAHGQRVSNGIYHANAHETRVRREGVKRQGKLCAACFGQSHRRSRFGGCWLCHEPYQALPPVELVTHKYYEVAW